MAIYQRFLKGENKMKVPIELLVTIIVAIFASDGFWSYIRSKSDKRDNVKSAIEEGLVALLHDRIYELSKFYIKSGHITFSEFDNLTYLYKPYEKLGGNSNAPDLYAKCKDLPRKEDRTNNVKKEAKK